MPTSASVEEYLEAIYKLQQQEHPVKVSQLAGAVGVAPASATEMTKKLAEEGFVNRTKGVGVCLTAKGRELAVKTVRKHRLVERFLTDVLGMPWDRVHEEACLFEHVVSEDVEAGLEKLLGEPETCPHGYPIPDRDGQVEEQATSEPLSGAEAGQMVRVAAVQEDDTAMLSYLASLGLLPGVEVKVAEVAPFGGPHLIEVGGARYALGREVASKVMVVAIKGAAGSARGAAESRRGRGRRRVRGGK